MDRVAVDKGYRVSIADLAPDLGSAGTCSFERMSDDHLGLQIIVERLSRGVDIARYMILFKNPGVAAYRMLDEGWRSSDLASMRNCGYPVLSLVNPSPWVDELSRTEPIPKSMAKDLKHYFICTGNECFDVLTHGVEPVVERISWSRL